MSVREILLLSIVAALCCAALIKPRMGLYGHIWYSLMRPDAIAWVEGVYPISMALAATTLIGSIRYTGRFPGLLTNPFVRRLLVLVSLTSISVIFPQTGPFLSPERYTEFLKSMLMVLLIPILIENIRHLYELLLVMGCSLGILGARFGVWALLQGGVIMNQNFSNVYDNNQLALAFVMGIPLCWYARYLVPSKLARLALLGMIGASMVAVVMSNSRGGSLSMGLCAGLIAMRSRRKVATISMLAAVTAGAVFLVYDQYVARMSTLSKIEDTSSDKGSAFARVIHAKVAIDVWRDYPLWGVGFGGRNYAHVSTRYLQEENETVIHNSYLQMAVDSGTPAFIAYLVLLFGTIFWLGRSAKRTQQVNETLMSFPRALQTSMIVFCLGSTFYSFQRFDFIYMLIMAAATWYWLEQDELQILSSSADEEDAGQPLQQAASS
jgi:probable O-glycosylation ligase (exosortase A-associated)